MSKRKAYTVETKIQALNFLQEHANVEKSAREFNVSAKTIRDWRGKEPELRKLASCCSTNKRSRLEGAGAKLTNEEMERELAEWILSMRQKRLRVSRKMIQRQALILFSDFCARKEAENLDTNTSTGKRSFVASNGWLQKFLQRNDFTLRKRTTLSQKLPTDHAEKVIKFICYIKELRLKYCYSLDQYTQWTRCLSGWNLSWT